MKPHTSFASTRRLSRLTALVAMGLVFTLALGVTAYAQPSNPVVSMTVTLPGGQVKELTAPESGLATLTLDDGTGIGFRPTIYDSKPWNRVVVTIFKTPSATNPSQAIAELDLKTGGPAVQSKGTPSFKVAVTKVSEPVLDQSRTPTQQ